MKFADDLLLPREVHDAIQAAKVRINSGKAAHVPRKCWHGFEGAEGMHLLMVERCPDGAVEVYEVTNHDFELVRLTA